MKKSVLFSLLFLFLIITSAQAQWQQLGPVGGIVYSAVYSGNTILAGTDDGVFKSIDNGATWSYKGPAYASIVSLLLVGNRVIAASNSYGTGIQVSDDLGETWQLVSADTIAASSLVKESSGLVTKTRIFAGTNIGVHVSTDMGATWSHTPLNDQSVNAMAYGNSTVYAALSSGLMKISTDHGATWTNSTLSGHIINSILINNNNIYTACADGITISTDNGTSWNNQPLNNNSVYSLCWNNNILYAGTNLNGMFSSSDNGNTWSPLALSGKNISSIQFVGSAMIASSRGFGLFSSVDNGQNWTQYPLYAMDIQSIAQSTVGGVTSLLVATSGTGIFRSTDLGQTWSQNGFMNRTTRVIKTQGSKAYAGFSQDAGFGFSQDGGATWIQKSIPGSGMYSMTLNGSLIFAGTAGLGVVVSSDDGSSWTQTPLNNKYVYAMTSYGTHVYAGTNSGIYHSPDNGATWTQTSVNSGLIFGLTAKLNGTGMSVFAGKNNNSAVYVSNDDGASWSLTSLSSQSIYSLGSNDKFVFAGTSNNAAYVSSDNGVTWENWNDLIGTTRVTGFEVIDNFVYAGTWGKSVFRHQLPDLTGTSGNGNIVPKVFSLKQNYPNPFNPSSKISFDIPVQSFVTLKVFDEAGKEVQQIVNELRSPGSYNVSFDGTNLASGVYFYKLEAGKFSDVKKMILIK